jgi:DNA polymerase-3 subunit epsilon
MKILFYDTETSGLPRWDLPADDPIQPRIVDIAGVLCEVADGTELARFEALIKPEGWEIDEQTAKIHGITTEIAARDGIPIAEALDQFEALVSEAGVLAAFNLRFDEKLLRGERRRLGRPDGFGTVPVFCCMKGATPLCKIKATQRMRATGRGGQFKTPNLGEAVKILLEREHAGAHRAMADALAARDIYFACRHLEEFALAGANFKTNQERDA